MHVDRTPLQVGVPVARLWFSKLARRKGTDRVGVWLGRGVWQVHLAKRRSRDEQTCPDGRARASPGVEVPLAAAGHGERSSQERDSATIRKTQENIKNASGKH